MTCDRCDECDELIARENLLPGDEEAIGAHLASCAACARRAEREARLADAVVAASMAVGRVRRTFRRAVSGLLAASLLTCLILSLRLARRPAETVYVLSGDATGVVLTGPGVSRRVESPGPRARPKGERL